MGPDVLTDTVSVSASLSVSVTSDVLLSGAGLASVWAAGCTELQPASSSVSKTAAKRAIFLFFIEQNSFPISKLFRRRLQAAAAHLKVPVAAAQRVEKRLFLRILL